MPQFSRPRFTPSLSLLWLQVGFFMRLETRPQPTHPMRASTGEAAGRSEGGCEGDAETRRSSAEGAVAKDAEEGGVGVPVDTKQALEAKGPNERKEPTEESKEAKEANAQLEETKAPPEEVEEESSPFVVATRVSWQGWRHGRARVEVSYDPASLALGLKPPLESARVRHYLPEEVGRIRLEWGWRLLFAWSFNLLTLLCAWLLVAAHVILVQRGSSERLAACGLSIDAWFDKTQRAFAYGLFISLLVIDCTKALMATAATHPQLMHLLSPTTAKQRGGRCAQLSARLYHAIYSANEFLIDVAM